MMLRITMTNLLESITGRQNRKGKMSTGENTLASLQNSQTLNVSRMKRGQAWWHGTRDK